MKSTARKSTARDETWIQDINIHKGSLRKWLGTKKDIKIPMKTLRTLQKKKVGSKYKGKTLTKHRKRQVNLAINFKKMRTKK